MGKGKENKRREERRKVNVMGMDAFLMTRYTRAYPHSQVILRRHSYFDSILSISSPPLPSSFSQFEPIPSYISKKTPLIRRRHCLSIYPSLKTPTKIPSPLLYLYAFQFKELQSLVNLTLLHPLFSVSLSRGLPSSCVSLGSAAGYSEPLIIYGHSRYMAAHPPTFRSSALRGRYLDLDTWVSRYLSTYRPSIVDLVRHRVPLTRSV